MRLVLDTNILIDYAIDRRPFSNDAQLLMQLGYLKELELWMGTSQVSDLVYVLTEGGKPNLAAHAQSVMKALKKMIHVYATDEEDYDFVATCSWTDLEDAFVYQTARKVKAQAIVTRDHKGFAKSSIPCFTCKDLFVHIEQTQGISYANILLK